MQRHRRRDPQRTGPIRNAGEAWREGEPARDSARRWGDAASSGVREGYRVIDEQIRRGRKMAQELDDEPWSGGDPYGRERRRPRDREEPRPRYGGGGLLGMPMRHMERLAREILRQIVSARPDPWRLAGLLFQLQIEAVSELARLGFSTLGVVAPNWGDSFEEDVDRVARDIDESLDEIEDFEDFEDEETGDEPWPWAPAPSTPTTIRSSVPIPVYVSSHELTEVDLELPAGSQSLDLEVEPPRAAGADATAPPEPAFEADFVTFVEGPAILRIEIPRDLPAGRYLRRVLIRATGEPVGDLTVQVGTLPATAARKASPRGRKKP